MEYQLEVDEQKLDGHFREKVEKQQKNDDVHVEGKNKKENHLIQKENKELKPIEPWGDNTEYESRAGKLLRVTSVKVTLNDYKETKTENLEVEKNKTLNNQSPPEETVPKSATFRNNEKEIKRKKISKQEYVSKHENVKKDKCDEEESLSKSIGDRKRVSFLVDDDKKIPRSHNFRATKHHNTKNMHTERRATHTKSQINTPEEKGTPRREKLKDTNKIQIVNKEKKFKKFSSESVVRGKPEASPNREKHEKELISDKSPHFNIETESEGCDMKKNSTEENLNLIESLNNNYNVNCRIHRSVSLENEGVIRGEESAKKAEKFSSDICVRTNNEWNLIKDVSKPGDLSVIGNVDNREEYIGYKSKWEVNQLVSVETEEDAEKKGRAEENQNLITLAENSTDQNYTPSCEGESWFTYAVDTLSHFRFRRIAFCLGWLLWASWIIRLMGFHRFGQISLPDLVKSVFRLEYVGVLELILALQVLVVLCFPGLRPADSAPTPDPACTPVVTRQHSNRVMISHSFDPGLIRKAIKDSSQEKVKMTHRIGSLELFTTDE